MRLTALVIVITVFAGSALALPAPAAHPAQACSDADRQLDGAFASSWYEACGGAASGEADARTYPTQITISCSTNPNRCTYLPTYHISVDGTLAGDWVLRGESHLRAGPASGTWPLVAGSQRTMECRASTALGSCHAQADGPEITAGNFNTFRWEGSWSLSWVDPQGVEHLTSTGGHSCYVAQYYGGGVC